MRAQPLTFKLPQKEKPMSAQKQLGFDTSYYKRPEERYYEYMTSVGRTWFTAYSDADAREQARAAGYRVLYTIQTARREGWRLVKTNKSEVWVKAKTQQEAVDKVNHRGFNG